MLMYHNTVQTSFVNEQLSIPIVHTALYTVISAGTSMVFGGMLYICIYMGKRFVYGDIYIKILSL